MSVIGPFTVPYDKFAEFVKLYDSGHYAHQRFGQAFCNHFNVVWPDIFYTTSRKVAEEVLYSTVVK